MALARPVAAPNGCARRLEAELLEAWRRHFSSRSFANTKAPGSVGRSDRAAAGYSPDRVDALVWAFSELLVKPMNCEGIYELYRRRDAEAAAQRSKPQPTQTLPQPGSMEWFEAQKKKG